MSLLKAAGFLPVHGGLGVVSLMHLGMVSSAPEKANAFSLTSVDLQGSISVCPFAHSFDVWNICRSVEGRDKEYTFDSGIGVDEGPCESRTPVSSMETGKM